MLSSPDIPQRLNRELPQFFRDNPLTSANGKNKDYKCVRG